MRYRKSRVGLNLLELVVVCFLLKTQGETGGRRTSVKETMSLLFITSSAKQPKQAKNRSLRTDIRRERDVLTFDVLLSSANKLTGQGVTKKISFQSRTTIRTNHVATIE